MSKTRREWALASEPRDGCEVIRCVCGNEVISGGFYPASPEGWVSPDAKGPWDGDTVGCADCGRLFATWRAESRVNLDDKTRDYYPRKIPVIGRMSEQALNGPMPD